MKAREAAVYILNKIENNASFANLELKKILRDVEAKEKALATELVYGVLRYRLKLDYIWKSFSSLKESKISLPVKNILRVGIYQIMFLDKIPQSAACNECVKLVYKYSVKSATGFVNAILRNVCRNKDNIAYPSDFKENLSVNYSFPIKLVDLFIRDYGEEQAENILKNLNINGSVCVRPNLLKISAVDFEQCLEKSEVLFEKGDGCYYIKSLLSAEDDLFKEGYCTIQGRSSMMSVELLSPQKNDKVLDICAAPGGKTCYMAQLMNNCGEITACDIHEHRTELIQKNAKRLGVSIAKTMVNDASVYNPEFDGMFDRVLADVPCSGLGVISNKPDIKYNELNFDSLTDLQYNILSCAGRYLKKGGFLVYSTCTLNKDENERVVERFLSENSDFNRESDYMTVSPDDMHDGFFMCKLKRCE